MRFLKQQLALRACTPNHVGKLDEALAMILGGVLFSHSQHNVKCKKRLSDIMYYNVDIHIYYIIHVLYYNVYYNVLKQHTPPMKNMNKDGQKRTERAKKSKTSPRHHPRRR